VEPRTVRNWEQEEVLRDKRGRYDIAKLDAHRLNGNPEKPNVKQQVLFADLDLKSKKSELAQLQINMQSGKLILVEEIDRQRVSRIIEVRRVLMSLVRKLPAKLQNLNVHRMQEVCRDEIYRCLDIFAGEKLEPSGDRIRELLEYYGNLTPAEKRVFKTILEKRKKKSATENTPDKNIRGQAEIKK